MGGKGGGQNTVTNNSTPPPEVMEQYRHILGLANDQSGQPLQQYGGPMVAGFTPDQMSAFQGINNAQGIASPYFDNARGMLNDSTRDIWNGVQQWSPQAMQQYMNPYTDDVVNSTMANMNETFAQQNQNLIGDAISKGAWGGDRAGIAQAEQSRQQALAAGQTIGGLRSQGYNTALGAFQQQQGAQLGAEQANRWLSSQGASGMANLGTQAFQNSLQGAGAQLASGTTQQQQNQAEMNIPYEQFLQQQAFPYQNLSWLSGISTGLGSGMGGTSSSTQPAPNGMSSGLGTLGSLGMLGYMAFSDRRLKDHIKKIGAYKDYPLYEFRYKGDNVKNVGVMAQDVEKSNPAAVREAGGYKMVDYSKLARGGAAPGIAPRYSQGGFSTIPDAPQLQPEKDSSGQDMQMMMQIAKMAMMHRGGNVKYAPGGAIPDVSISYIPGAANTSQMAHSTIPNAPKIEPPPKQDASKTIGMIANAAKMGSDLGHTEAFGGAGNPLGLSSGSGFTGDDKLKLADAFSEADNDMAIANGPMNNLPWLAGGFARGGYAPGGSSPYDDEMAQAMQYLYADPNDQPIDGVPPNIVPTNAMPPAMGMGPPPAPMPFAPAQDQQPSGIAPTQRSPMPDTTGIVGAEPTYNKPDPSLALLSGFASMASGKSPYFAENFGAGVESGVKTWSEQKKAAANESYNQGSLKAQAERLYNDAIMSREKLDEERDYHKHTIENQRSEINLKARQKWTIDPNTGMPMNVYTGEMKNPYAGVDTTAAWDEKGAPIASVPDAYFPDMTPTQIMQYRNAVKKNQPKDLASQQSMVSSLVDQKTKIDDLVKQIPIASSGDLHTIQDFADRNKLPIFSDPERGAATVAASYDTLGNVLDNIKTTFGGTGRVLQAEFNTLKTELNAAANLSPEQKAVVVAKIQTRLDDIIKSQVQYTNDVASGMAYMPPQSASGKPIYQSPMLKSLTAMKDNQNKEEKPAAALGVIPPVSDRIAGKTSGTVKGKPVVWNGTGWDPVGWNP